MWMSLDIGMRFGLGCLEWLDREPSVMQNSCGELCNWVWEVAKEQG
jgi:hypothetical protein